MALTFLDSPALSAAADGREARTGSSFDPDHVSVDDDVLVLPPAAVSPNFADYSDVDESIEEEGCVLDCFRDAKVASNAGLTASISVALPINGSVQSFPLSSPKLIPCGSPAASFLSLLRSPTCFTPVGLLSPFASSSSSSLSCAWEFPSVCDAETKLNPQPAAWSYESSDSDKESSAEGTEYSSPLSCDDKENRYNQTAVANNQLSTPADDEEDEDYKTPARKKRRTERSAVAKSRKAARSKSASRVNLKRGRKRVRDDDEDWVGSDDESDDESLAPLPASPPQLESPLQLFPFPSYSSSLSSVTTSVANEVSSATNSSTVTLAPNSEISVLSISASRSVLSAQTLARLKAGFKKGWVPGALTPSDESTLSSLRTQAPPVPVTILPSVSLSTTSETATDKDQPSPAATELPVTVKKETPSAPTLVSVASAAPASANVAALALPLPAPEFQKKSNRGGRRGRRDNPLFDRPPRKARGELKAEKERKAKEREERKKQRLAAGKKAKQAVADPVTVKTEPVAAKALPLPTPLPTTASQPIVPAMPVALPLGVTVPTLANPFVNGAALFPGLPVPLAPTGPLAALLAAQLSSAMDFGKLLSAAGLSV